MSAPEWFVQLYRISIVASFILAIPSLLLHRHRKASFLGILAFLLVSGLWITRYGLAGHLPMFGALESSISLALFTGLILLQYSKIYRMPYLFLYPLVAGVLLFHGGHYSSEMYALTISERGFWVHLHAIVSFLTFAFAVTTLTSAVLILLSHPARLKGPLSLLYLGYTLTIISGSFYSFLLYGKVWSFDPMETMNLACFLAFTTLIHMMHFQDWPERKIAPWYIFCFVLLVAAFRLILIFPPETTYHIFDIDLRTHVLK